ncbi:MAG: nucleotide exchange factor GrpE [Patescibacteria group bacterium]|nr:nucleotide exchange factor GrpE [Patescibacteria group bacterium]MCL5431809.1 nucleotide exchange factor GrpE [Patescibacteria group bacterium]
MKKQEELEELKNKYLRALADYQNLEKQTANWKEEFSQYANVGLIRKLLEVLDDLEKAQDHIKDEGLELVLAKLKKILADEGLEELELEGKEYDPAQAEVISTEPGQENNKIIKVLQKGYKLKDKVIRVAKVVVWQKL